MPFNRPIADRKSKPGESGGVSAGGPIKDTGGVQTLIQAEKLFQIAILLPSAAFIGWLGGSWLDSKLHQSWIALAGIVFGGISGLVYVIRLVMASGDGASGNDDSKGGKGTTGPIS
jgi:ATP synthase protein I